MNSIQWKGWGLTIMMVTILLIAIISCILLWIQWKLNPPVCSGTIDPNQRYCENGNAKVGEIPEGVCSPIDESVYDENFVQFFLYLFRTMKSQSESNFFTQIQKAESYSSNWSLTPGNFFFATEELLRVLPTDFGQNNTTPYGILSFFDSFASCISDSYSLCETIIKTKTTGISEVLKAECLSYLNQRKAKECQFPIHDHNPSLYIQNKDFFNEIGLLGAISLNLDEVIVCRVQLPLQLLHLHYWSFNVYRTDDLSPSESCYPYRQINLASICPPLNCFTACSKMKSMMNPLKGDPSTKYFSFVLLLSMDQQCTDKIQTVIQELQDSTASSESPILFVHVFEIPTADGSMVLSHDIPNPNHLTSSSPLLDPSKQRLSMFLRLYPDPSYPSSFLHDFIYLKDSYATDCFSICKIKIPLSSTPSPYSSLSYPIMLNPPFDEVTHLSDSFKKLHQQSVYQLWSSSFYAQVVETRNSLFNIFAPLNYALLKGTIPYKGGYQAIQLAGNAQADNYDSQYRLSKAICLQENDVFIGFLVNHVAFQNVIYNSVNLVDTNKAFGYDAINLTYKEDANSPFYIVIASRTYSLLNQVEYVLQKALSNIEELSTTTIHKMWIETGPSIKSQIPECHQVMFVERSYINTLFQSSVDPTIQYDLTKIFGKTLEETSLQDIPIEVQKSLQNLCAPLLDFLISPVFMKLSYQEFPYQRSLLFLTILFLLFLLIIVLVFFFRSHKQKNVKRTRA